jgi:hypothetical protein
MTHPIVETIKYTITKIQTRWTGQTVGRAQGDYIAVQECDVGEDRVWFLCDVSDAIFVLL